MGCKKSVATDTKYVYSFGGDNSEGNETMRSLLGGKGANLAGMAALGLPVPPGFTITTEACAEYGVAEKGAVTEGRYMSIVLTPVKNAPSKNNG